MEHQVPDVENGSSRVNNLPRIVPEDSVNYAIYIIDSSLDSSTVRERLRQIQTSASKLIKQHLTGFIWQRDDFVLNLVVEDGRHLLRGQTNYGDSITDEWLIVWLLRELSRQFSTAYISVTDADGQFLLIEAANVLPLWLSPEIADFRVWINNGHLLIIPMKEPGGKNRRFVKADDSVNLNQALDNLQNDAPRLLHSTKIEKEAFYRLEKFPAEISDNMHHALIKIPRKLAFILYEEERYIAKAIEAFYLRDPIALRPLQASDSQALVFPPVDFVTVSAKFPKVGFAQLVSQAFSAPQAWRAAAISRGDARPKQYAEAGMKVTCGFEMLLADPQNKDAKQVREIQLLLNELDSGEAQLPKDNDIRAKGMKEDDQSWLDIDFAQFERELDGKPDKGLPNTGFGDRGTQEHLRKLVARFGDLLEDDNRQAESAEYLDDGDEDYDSSDDGEDDSASDSSNDPIAPSDGAELSEDDFTRMMRELMDMPPEVMQELMKAPPTFGTEENTGKKGTTVDAVTGTSSSHGAEGLTHDQILQATKEMEEELRDAGALYPETDEADAV